MTKRPWLIVLLVIAALAIVTVVVLIVVYATGQPSTGVVDHSGSVFALVRSAL
jgi:hypothetical protein